MTPSRAGGLAVAIALASGCGSKTRTAIPGEIVLYLDTDAPLPAPGGAPLPASAPLPLFDRARIEFFAPAESAACAACVNTFELDSDLFKSRSASVGFAPPVGVAGYRARVRMYLASLTDAAGEPDPAGAVDVTVALPPVESEGKIALTVQLDTDSVGVPRGSLDAPLAPAPGAPPASRVGAWPSAQRIACASGPQDGEACVPGGAFWLGSEDTLIDALPGHDALRPHLVVLSPYFLKTTEVTVAEFRASGVAPLAWSGGATGTNVLDFCTYTAAKGSHEDQPVNCVTWAQASRYCQTHGGDLPTEAQYEFVAGGLVGHRFVWGEDSPACADAVFGRAGYGIFAAVAPCQPQTPPGGVLPVGSGARDRLELSTGTIVDLSANVSEWTKDDWNHHDEPCWTAPGVLQDPDCRGKAADGLAHPVRGGEWLVTPGQLVRTERIGAPLALVTPETGFRCARPGGS